MLSKNNLTLKAIEPDLVDKIWTSDRPPQPSTDINVLDIKYAGKSRFIFYRNRFKGINFIEPPVVINGQMQVRSNDIQLNKD